MDRVFAVDIKSVFTPANSYQTLGDLTTVIIKNAFMLAGLISFILLIVGGFGVIVGAGGGDSKKLESAKGTIVAAVTGLLIVVGSLWIVQIIETLTGAKLLGP